MAKKAIHDKMTLKTFRQIALMLLILCVITPTESHYHERGRDRKRIKTNGPSSLASQQPQIATKITSINLCSKERDMKLVCHCVPDDINAKASKADCWIFVPDFPQRDPTWLAFHTQTLLQHLKITIHGSGNLSYVPTNVIHTLKHLKTISIEFGQINEIFSFSFGNLTQLLNISLPNNQIKLIHHFAFANHPHLIDVNLQKNEILIIDSLAFVNLPNLNRLNLRYNLLESIEENTFEHLSNLQELLLSHNNIHQLSDDMFKGLVNLKSLKMDSNKVTDIDDTSFAKLWNIEAIDLSNNKIEQISHRAFDGLSNLNHLNLANNRLKQLERGVFAGVPALTYLNLMKNSLETITYYNIQPLMDNLVNHTSTLSITDNNFICDCRMSWLFELKNRTKNLDLKYSLEEIVCTMKADDKKGNADDDNVNGMRSNDQLEDEVQYYEDEAYDDTQTVHFMQLKPQELPCAARYRQPTETPSLRESIGFDFSWIHSSADAVQSIKSQHIVALLISFIASIITNFC